MTWVAELLDDVQREQRSQLTDKEHALYIQRKWRALAPDFFRFIIDSAKTAVDEFNQYISDSRTCGSRMTVEVRNSTDEVTFTFEHLILVVQMSDDKELITCCGDSFAARSYRIVMLADDTFVLRVYSAVSADGPTISRGSEAKTILHPLFRKAGSYLRLV